MTTIQINLPDEMARRADRAGFLSDDAMRDLLEEAIRRQAGRALLGVAEHIQALSGRPMSEEAIVAAVGVVRAARRERDAGRS